LDVAAQPTVCNGSAVLTRKADRLHVLVSGVYIRVREGLLEGWYPFKIKKKNNGGKRGEVVVGRASKLSSATARGFLEKKTH